MRTGEGGGCPPSRVLCLERACAIHVKPRTPALHWGWSIGGSSAIDSIWFVITNNRLCIDIWAPTELGRQLCQGRTFTNYIGKLDCSDDNRADFVVGN